MNNLQIKLANGDYFDINRISVIKGISGTPNPNDIIMIYSDKIGDWDKLTPSNLSNIEVYENNVKNNEYSGFIPVSIEQSVDTIRKLINIRLVKGTVE